MVYKVTLRRRAVKILEKINEPYYTAIKLAIIKSPNFTIAKLKLNAFPLCLISCLSAQCFFSLYIIRRYFF